MTSTFVNDLRLNEQATGDNSGSWGTVTNTNLELIGDAFGYGTEAITTDADTHNTIIVNAPTVSVGRSMFLKYTGALNSPCTVTITNSDSDFTISKLWFIHNATTGGEDIIITSGSGANVTIPAGHTKCIYTDGAGSGGAVVDGFAGLSAGANFYVKNPATADNSTANIYLQTAEADIAVNDVLGKINFQAPDETSHAAGDNKLVAAAIQAISEGDFSQTNNATSLAFMTAASEAATTKMTLSSVGDLTLTSTTASSSSTTGAVKIGGGLGVAADLFVGDDLDVTGAVVIDETALVTGVLTTTAATVFNGGFASNANSSLSNGLAIGQTSFTGGNTLLDIHGSGSGVGANMAFANDHNTDKFFVGLAGDTTGDALIYNAEDSDLLFGTNNAEVARFDSGGRLLIGYTANTPVADFNSATQVVGQGTSDFHGAASSIIGFSNNSNGAYLNFASGRSNSAGTFTIVADDDTLGQINFAAADGTDMNSRAANITAFVDGAPGANDMPGRLVFSTTADGASSPTERMRITQAGLVGIACVPTHKLEIRNDVAASADLDPTAIKLYNNGDGGSAIEFSNTVAGKSKISFGVEGTGAGTDNTFLGFSTGADTALAEKVRIDSAGHLIINDGNLVIGTAGHGINFQAYGAGTNISSNLLDDYEEGTWTPTLKFGGGVTGILYSIRNGNYTKIGNRVFITSTISLSSKGTDTGHATIIGLPFNSSSTSQHTANAYNDRISAANGGPQFYNNGNEAQLALYEMDDDTSNNSIVTNSEFANNTFLVLTMQYFV